MIQTLLSRLVVLAGGCRSSGWALVLLACVSLALAGGVVAALFSFGSCAQWSDVGKSLSPLGMGVFLDFDLGLRLFGVRV